MHSFSAAQQARSNVGKTRDNRLKTPQSQFYHVPIPRTNPATSTMVRQNFGGIQAAATAPQAGYPFVQAAQPKQRQGFDLLATMRNLSGNQNRLDVASANAMQQQMQNPAQSMLSQLPSLQPGMPQDLQSLIGIGQRQQRAARERNASGMNKFLTTKPVEAQLGRATLASQIGVAQANLLRQMENMWQEYGLAQGQSRLGKMSLLGRQ